MHVPTSEAVPIAITVYISICRLSIIKKNLANIQCIEKKKKQLDIVLLKSQCSKSFNPPRITSAENGETKSNPKLC